HVANRDRENAFSVAFKTVPRDSTGVAHILEHTILCGSVKYPVRDPFFSMIRRSLNSFMNALTAADWTMYPFASPNRKDFYNLLDVYLDAVFFPLLTELSFKQEGHRLEVAGEGGDRNKPALVYKGVVYNEMKGAMSSPDQVMSRALMAALYPDTTYSNNSGGDPAVIPTLTWDQLREFHRRHYHPSNAYFYTYGDIPLSELLAVINDRVLCRFSGIDPGTRVDSQPRWQSPRTASHTYPLAPGEDGARKYQACVAWLMADVRENFEVFTLSLLEQVLLGNPGCPLYKALIDSGLGSALADGTGYDPDMKDTLFACGLKDVGKDDAGAVEKIIRDTLADVADRGIDPELVESAIHQIEFHRREISNTPYPYGIKLLLTLCGSWLHGTDPAEIIHLDPYLEKLRREMAAGPFLENCIRNWFLDNPHRVLFTLEPDPEMEAREEAREKRDLARIAASMTPADVERIKQDAAALEALQMADEDISVLPTLKLSDIDSGVQTAAPVLREERLCVYDQPTSGIFYFTSAAGIGLLAADLLPLVPFFCAALPRMGTRLRDYVALDRYIDMHTGGIGLSSQARTRHGAGGQCVPYLSFSGKCLDRKIDRMFDILRELLCDYSFADHQRLRQLLAEYRASLESSVVHNGHRYAISLASRHISAASHLSELWHGIYQLQYIKELAADLDGPKLEDVAEKLSRIARTIFVRDNLKTGLIGHGNTLKSAGDLARSMAAGLGTAGRPAGFAVDGLEYEKQPAREGWATATAVSFVASVFPAVRMDHEDAPVLAVISKLLRSSFLHREIREKGGAYGGFALYSPEDGRFCFASYRDPHIRATLEVYDRAADYIQSGDYTGEEITESVLQVCSDIDKPDTPAETATRAFYRDLVGLSDAERRRFKNGVLAVTRQAVQAVARRHFTGKGAGHGTAVISSEELLKKANARLTPPLAIHRI
ncbi:MAG: insulinase family protein, partial [Thermodesulfobacteriota bacterium]